MCMARVSVQESHWRYCKACVKGKRKGRQAQKDMKGLGRHMSRGQRAEGRGQRAEGRGQRAAYLPHEVLAVLREMAGIEGLPTLYQFEGPLSADAGRHQDSVYSGRQRDRSVTEHDCINMDNVFSTTSAKELRNSDVSAQPQFKVDL